MEQAGVAPGGDEPRPMAPGPIILVVDDDPLLGGVIEACLDYEGAAVRTAHTLEAARSALSEDLDHVVLDPRLPDGDGLDLLPELRERCPQADIVVFSAYDDEVPEGVVSVPKTDVAAL